MRRFVVGGLSVWVGGMLCGCSIPKMTTQQFKESLPQRPAQLDKLEMLMGTWEGEMTADFEFLEQPVTSKFTNHAAWDLDKRFMIERGTWQMADVGDMQGMGIWGYDTDANAYTVVWIGSLGEVSHGRAKYDEASRTWNIRAKGKMPGGHTSEMVGTAVLTDANSIQWNWNEWATCPLTGLRMAKVGEFKGTAHRKNP